MIITKKGKYEFLKDYRNRGVTSVSTIKKGEIIEITQIDQQGNKVYSPDFYDWNPYELPVKEVKP